MEATERDEVRGSSCGRDEGQWKQHRGMRSGEAAVGGMRVSGTGMRSAEVAVGEFR